MNKRSVKKISRGFLGVAALLMTFSCGNKNSSNNPTPTPAPVPVNQNQVLNNGYSQFGCQVISSQGNIISQAPSEASYTNIGGIGGQFKMQVCLQLIGEPTQIAQIQSAGKSAAYYYTGNMSLGGSIIISNMATMGSCLIPAGTYTVQSATVGLYNPVSFNASQFEAVSGANKITFQLRNGWTKDPDANYVVDRFALDMVALSVQANGTFQPACNDIMGVFLN